MGERSCHSGVWCRTGGRRWASLPGMRWGCRCWGMCLPLLQTACRAPPGCHHHLQAPGSTSLMSTHLCFLTFSPITQQYQQCSFCAARDAYTLQCNWWQQRWGSGSTPNTPDITSTNILDATATFTAFVLGLILWHACMQGPGDQVSHP